MYCICVAVFRVETFCATKGTKGKLRDFSIGWVSRTVDLRRLYDTRYNVTIVRFNDDDRGDWSRPTVAVVGIMHNLIRKTECVEGWAIRNTLRADRGIYQMDSWYFCSLIARVD